MVRWGKHLRTRLLVPGEMKLASDICPHNPSFPPHFCLCEGLSERDWGAGKGGVQSSRQRSQAPDRRGELQEPLCCPLHLPKRAAASCCPLWRGDGKGTALGNLPEPRKRPGPQIGMRPGPQTKKRTQLLKISIHSGERDSALWGATVQKAAPWGDTGRSVTLPPSNHGWLFLLRPFCGKWLTQT